MGDDSGEFGLVSKAGEEAGREVDAASGEGCGADVRVVYKTNYLVVAAQFPLAADARRDPPDGGMVKQQRLDQDLEKVDEVIVAADVGDLVGQNGFELFDRQSGDGRGA